MSYWSLVLERNWQLAISWSCYRRPMLRSKGMMRAARLRPWIVFAGKWRERVERMMSLALSSSLEKNPRVVQSRGWWIWVSHTKRSFGRLATFKTGKIDVESRSHLQRRTPKCSFFLSSCSLLMWRTSITDARINVDRNAFQRPDAIGKASPQFPLRFTVRKSQSKNLCILFFFFRFSSFFF